MAGTTVDAMTVDSVLAPAGPPEVTVVTLHRHVRILVVPSLILIGCAGAAGWLTGPMAPAWAEGLLPAGLVGVGLLVAIVAWTRWWSRRWTVTTARVISERGVMVRRRAELLHARGMAAELSQTPGQRIVGSGTITLSSAGGPVMELVDVPRGRLLLRALEELEAGAAPRF